MSFLTLNIGLDAQGTKLHAAQVFRLLDRAGAVISQATIVQSDTEPTMVVIADIDPAAIYGIAETLLQDCIAVWDGEVRKGWLSGPRADAWGAFQARFFFVPNGRRLTEVIGEEIAAEVLAARKAAADLPALF